ncbi:G-D-S-L family lipolytic protein [Planktothrix tepida]|uniref:G-D-S-L family lipolytic protein n=1 Tax=Planktothrix tepida PCC 9214 TaxID=671072 RepID=A0A1J1LK09_9CYAN|nr:GDSL-type esterase/lipase family protein [Planktothrix tepida]CAD5948538.1 G-D-S-L family lipolytic protein [Planktothrix tepida]CUR31921.1 G-D-S-L family lipolytic protein [Planktothrix tepida PCC 9214]
MRTLSPQSFSHFPKPYHPHLPMRIVALGDSLIYGFGDPVGGGWVERLRRLWMSPNHPGHALYNLGVRGNGVAQVSQRLEKEWSHRGEFRNRQPELMILSVGVNDSPRLGRANGRPFTEFEHFHTQLNHLLDQAVNLCPVFFVGMVPVDESKMPFLDCFYYNHADQYRYKQATQLACEQRQIPYLDIFDLWLKRGEHWRRLHLSADGLHPNIRGYQALLHDILNWEPMSGLHTYLPSWETSA